MKITRCLSRSLRIARAAMDSLIVAMETSVRTWVFVTVYQQPSIKIVTQMNERWPEVQGVDNNENL